MKTNLKIMLVVNFTLLALVVMQAIHNHNDRTMPTLIEMDPPADPAKFETWYLDVKIEFSEDFWNLAFDHSNLNEQPYYNYLLQWYYANHLTAKRAAHFIMENYLGQYNRCLDSVDGTDSECDSCFNRVFGKDRK